ncbi:MAG: 2-oxo acid dehydrogenase subunit [Solirubrobacterales bacterium]|nr:2-oxo acid dehydrogenase subunit [Solirubrobacterales bacterium]
MTDITMPRLSDQMEEGTILTWLATDGDDITEGQDLLEIETDKATVTHPAEVAGVLRIVAAEGTTVAVGDVIARVGGAASPQTAAAAEPQAPAPTPAPAPAVDAAPAVAVASNGHGGSPEGRAASTAGPGTIAITPLARRIARQHDVAIDQLVGSGPRGRITRTDVLTAAGIAPPPSAPTATVAPAAATATPAVAAGGTDGAKDGVTVQELTRLQQIVARRMTEAKATVPHFQVQTEAVMDEAMALRAQLKALATGEDEHAPSVNDLIVRASALALRRHPLVNGSFKDGHYELHDRINVGVAVASDAGLLVVTIPDADKKSLGEIARETRRLAARARTGEIGVAELAGGTFTVSNLGMFGMTAIVPVINPPQAAILGVGAARPTLVRGADGEIVDRSLLTITLSCDHRILNGADASRFLADVRDLLQAPLKLAF